MQLFVLSPISGKHIFFVRAETLLSAPISLIVQEVKTSVNKTLIEDACKYDPIMGKGAAQEVIDCIGIQFNMDGKPIPGCNVPLLDKQHLWSLYMDPFSHIWESTFKMEGSTRAHAIEMVAHYVQLWAPRCLARRESFLEEFEISMCFLHNIFWTIF